MLAAVLPEPGAPLQIEEIPVPAPRRGFGTGIRSTWSGAPTSGSTAASIV